MAQYKVLKGFNGIKEGKEFKAGEVVELTVKRADEITKNIKNNFSVEGVLERLDDANDEAPEQPEVAEQTNDEAAE